MTPMNKKN